MFDNAGLKSALLTILLISIFLIIGFEINKAGAALSEETAHIERTNPQRKGNFIIGEDANDPNTIHCVRVDTVAQYRMFKKEKQMLLFYGSYGSSFWLYADTMPVELFSIPLTQLPSVEITIYDAKQQYDPIEEE